MFVNVRYSSIDEGNDELFPFFPPMLSSLLFESVDAPIKLRFLMVAGCSLQLVEVVDIDKGCFVGVVGGSGVGMSILCIVVAEVDANCAEISLLENIILSSATVFGT